MAISRIQPMRPAEIDLLDHMDSAEGDITQLQEDLNQEIVNRQQADTALDNRLDNAEDDIETNTENIDKYAYPMNNPIYYGADPNGINDSADAINTCIAENTQVIFSPGTYLIRTPIKTEHIKRVNIDFNGAKIISEIENEYAIGIGVLGEQDTSPHLNRVFLTNLELQNGYPNSDLIGIYIENGYKNLVIKSSNINGFFIGVKEYSETGIAGDLQINDCKLEFDDMQNESNGLLLNGSDNKISDSRIYGYKFAVNSVDGGNFLDNIHCLPNGSPTVEMLENSALIYSQGSADCITNCYADTVGSFILFSARSTAHVNLLSNTYFSYRTDLRQIFVNAGNLTNYLRGIIKNNRIGFSGADLDHVGFLAPINTANNNAISKQILRISDNLITTYNGASYDYGDYILSSDSVQYGNWSGITTTEDTGYYIGSVAFPNSAFFANIELLFNLGVPTPARALVEITATPQFAVRIIENSTADYAIGLNIREAHNHKMVDVYLISKTGSLRSPVTMIGKGVYVQGRTSKANMTTKPINELTNVTNGKPI